MISVMTLIKGKVTTNLHLKYTVPVYTYLDLYNDKEIKLFLPVMTLIFEKVTTNLHLHNTLLLYKYLIGNIISICNDLEGGRGHN